MNNMLHDKGHWKEYLLYGSLSGILYIIPSLIFLAIGDYNNTYILFLGSIIFMFVIMSYTYKLSRRRTEYRSTWMRIVAAHIAVLMGIAVSVLLTLLLCFIFIPGFLSGHSIPMLKDAPGAYNIHNTGTVLMLFVCATVENFGVGGSIAIVGAYLFK